MVRQLSIHGNVFGDSKELFCLADTTISHSTCSLRAGSSDHFDLCRQVFKNFLFGLEITIASSFIDLLYLEIECIRKVQYEFVLNGFNCLLRPMVEHLTQSQ